ncbi:hypothetical protein Poli38472_004894 [Pythium oligandrum]|uniref:Uncharacterized protein n=1 Tax=Pythium oligandrum TaxID=41045 RepID=A0A8K1CBM1_PYTOL|nr:hypothetical protein Poli38472_004894 [Pythium oligandrum]|eukprot:TMW59825.1 hypothetical protein Poli38472_004894 [Pythium oligandrum]
MDELDALLGNGDENATLEAALAFVDAFHVDGEPLDSVADAFEVQSAGSDAEKTKAKPKKRDRKREELLYLREVVQGLETQLDALQSRQGSRRETNCSSDDPQGVWKRFAHRQHRERQRAEDENVRLRVMLEDQLRLTKSLERMLNKRGNVELLSSEPSTSTKRLRRANIANPLDAQDIMLQLNAVVDEMYLATDEVFADPRFNTTATRRESELVSDASTGTRVHNYEIRMLPFTFRVTSEAFWDLILARINLTVGKDTHQMREVEEDNVSTKSYEGNMTWGKTDNIFRVKVLGRRYVESDRVVIVGSMLMEPLHLNGEPLEDVYMRVRVWRVLKPHQTDPNDPSSPQMTLHQTFNDAVPECYADLDPMTFQHKVRIFTNFLLNAARAQMDLAEQLVENRLADSLAQMKLEDM